ncbi:hypothetical protein H0H93_005293 [Arthromyces matolae]|nr:hypothetical protein H0H93_005293 [Arthromyces matolae]
MPGGRFIFVSHHDGLECMDIYKNDVIWEYDCRWPLGKVNLYAANVHHGLGGIEYGVILVVAIRTREPNFSSRKNYVEVLHLNLNEGTSTPLHVIPVPYTQRDNPFTQIHINDDCALVNMGSTSTAGNILGSFDMGLIPGHLVGLIMNVKKKTLELRLWDIYQLLSADDDTVFLPLLDNFPSIYSEAIGRDVFMFRISIHPSPLVSNSSRLWIVYLSDPKTGEDITMYRKYLITHPINGPVAINPSCEWKEDIGKWIILPKFDYEGGISYAGSMAGYYRRLYFQTLSDDGISKKDLQLDYTHGQEGNCVFVSAFSGAVAYDKGGSVVIRYYR